MLGQKIGVTPQAVPAPEMPTIRVDPAVAHNSLRVIAAAEAEASAEGRPPTGIAASHSSTVQKAGEVSSAPSRLNEAAIAAAKAAAPSEQTTTLFQHLVLVNARAA